MESSTRSEETRESESGPLSPEGARAVRRRDLATTAAGGLVTAITLFLAVWSVGLLGTAEARVLLESSFPSIRFLASSVVTVGATVLALMLTVLGFSESADRRFRTLHYRRIKHISLMTVVAIVASVALLLLLSVPLEESETLRAFYDYVYYAFLAATSLLGGLVVAIVLLLHRTIKGLATAVSPEERTGRFVRDGGD